MVSLTKKRSNFLIVMMVAVVMMISFMISGAMVASATSGGEIATVSVNNVTGALSEKVYDKLVTLGRKYDCSGGGVLLTKDLFTDIGSTGNKYYIINESGYNRLTSSAQSNLINDLDACAKEAVSENPNTYSDETITNWYQRLQSQDGVGSKMLNVILSQTKPDFITANKIYQPFSGLVGTALGLGAVLIMAALGIVMVADISYITLPPVRLFAGEESERKGVKTYIFSHDATYAVEQAENNDGGDGNAKQALGIYFKRRVIMLIMLGICLLYLVSGRIYQFVGLILDLVSGFA